MVFVLQNAICLKRKTVFHKALHRCSVDDTKHLLPWPSKACWVAALYMQYATSLQILSCTQRNHSSVADHAEGSWFNPWLRQPLKVELHRTLDYVTEDASCLITLISVQCGSRLKWWWNWDGCIHQMIYLARWNPDSPILAAGIAMWTEGVSIIEGLKWAPWKPMQGFARTFSNWPWLLTFRTRTI